MWSLEGKPELYPCARTTTIAQKRCILLESTLQFSRARRENCQLDVTFVVFARQLAFSWVPCLERQKVRHTELS